jgi:hypothetical protein
MASMQKFIESCSKSTHSSSCCCCCCFMLLYYSLVNSFQAISVIRGARYGVFTNKKHPLNTLKMGRLLRSDVMLS